MNEIMDTSPLESIIVADCGTTMTRVSLVVRVDESYRLIAQAEALSTHRRPWQDITLGVTDAIRLLEEQTGRHLLDDEAMLIQPQVENTGWGRCLCHPYQRRRPVEGGLDWLDEPT